LIDVDGKTIQYSLARSKRKTIGIMIMISRDKGVMVKAPKNVSVKQIEDIVRQKAHWIIKKLAQIERAAGEIPKKEYLSGEKFLYLGKEYVLKVIDEELTPEIYITGSEIYVYVPFSLSGEERSRKVRELLLNCYLEKATMLFKQRVEIYAKMLGVSPAKIAIKNTKSRWGSASSKGNINLNWRLIMSPLSVIDYVIVHELCHLKEMNHSKAFWLHVESILPDYKENRKWLKENGHKLYL
jgi:predicted metal-dependent hydrolase